MTKDYCQRLKREGKTIASIDTDAELHDGHMSLVKIAKENADVVVLSAGHSVDYKEQSAEEYTKSLLQYRKMSNGLSRDIELAKSNGVDVFFYIGGVGDQLYIDDLSIPIEMCEKAYAFWRNRDTFDATISPRLTYVLSTYFPVFNVIMPDITVVGQKDAYQNFGLKSLIKQLGLPIKVVIAPIIRDSDGLACSSRNKLLTQSDRQRAVSIYQTLQEVSTWSKIESIDYIKRYITSHIQSDECYVDICCAETLEELNALDRDAIIMISAGPFSEVDDFLTDNIFIYQ